MLPIFKKKTFFLIELSIILNLMHSINTLNLKPVNSKKSLCDSGLCSKNGKCEKVFGQEVCKCKSGFLGIYCQLEDPCQNPNTCNMNGICFPFIQENEDKEEANFYCQCNPGFKGRNCEMASKPCFSNPCFNNGICVNVVDESDSNDFTCICMNGYVGKTCGAYVGPCYYNECQNNATCTEEHGNTYTCKCKPGYYGDFCQFETNECILKENGVVYSPCQNNGRCHDRIDSYFCECVGSYSGKNCEEYINPCDSSPCSKGSRCVAYESSYQCECLQGYYGSKCLANPCIKRPCKVPSSRCYPVDSTLGASPNATINLANEDLFVCVCANINQEFVGKDC